MVGLDLGRVLGAGLDDVGVQRALDQESGVLVVGRHFLEDADERLADDLALALGVGDVVEGLDEAVGGLHVHEVDAELATERLLDLLGLVHPQQTGVHEDTRQLIAHRLVHEGSGDRRVDAAREAADHLLVADLSPDRLDRLLDDRNHRPRRPASADVVEEVLEDLLAAPRVCDLGVELHAVDGALEILEGGHRHRVGAGRDLEARRGGDDGVGVGHPHLLLQGQLAEQGRRRGDLERRAAVLAGVGAGDLAAELLGHQLGAVADAEDGNAAPVDGLVDGGRPFDMHRLGTAAEDDPLGSAGEHVGDRHVAGDDLRVHVRLAHAPGDQLRVLGAEVDDEDGVEGLGVGAQCPMPTPWDRCRLLPSVFRAGATMTSAFWNSLTDS